MTKGRYRFDDHGVEELPRVGPTCKHGRTTCPECGSDAYRDHGHRTQGGKGAVAKAVARDKKRGKK